MMKTNTSSHEEIARRAEQIWIVRGRPSGHDTAIWLEAEGELTVAPPEAPVGNSSASTAPSASAGENLAAVSRGVALAEPVDVKPAAGHPHGSEAPAPSPDDIVAKAAIQKNVARAPQLQHGKNAPRPASTESGKPLWDKPHFF